MGGPLAVLILAVLGGALVVAGGLVIQFGTR